jgi:hypothetical protein
MEHWDGTRWRLQRPPTPATNQNLLFSVLALSADDVWATGQGENKHYPFGGLLLYHWDGTAWSLAHFEPVLGSFIYDLDESPSGTIWGVGGFGDAYFGSSATYVARICPAVVSDSGFAPEVATASFRMPTEWRFDPLNTATHSVADATGLGLFDSGPRGSGGSFVYQFPAAGTYTVVDADTGNQESVQVPLVVGPKNGTSATTFHLRWAPYGWNTGLVFDVQIERPGETAFSTWRRGDPALAAPFIPDAGPGTYAFRVRARDRSTGAGTGWSPVATIAVPRNDP